MTWIAGGHPVLDATVLGQEASKNLGLLLNQLRTPEASTLPCLVAIVIINRLMPYTSFCLSSPRMLGTVLRNPLEEIKLIFETCRVLRNVGLCSRGRCLIGNMTRSQFVMNLIVVIVLASGALDRTILPDFTDLNRT